MNKKSDFKFQYLKRHNFIRFLCIDNERLALNSHLITRNIWRKFRNVSNIIQNSIRWGLENFEKFFCLITLYVIISICLLFYTDSNFIFDFIKKLLRVLRYSILLKLVKTLKNFRFRIMLEAIRIFIRRNCSGIFKGKILECVLIITQSVRQRAVYDSR